MPTISSLIVLVQAKTEQFQSGMAKAEATTASAGSGMSKFGGVATLAVAAAGLAVAKFGESSVQAFQSVAGDTRVLEKQLGITAEQASVLRAQAEALGVPVDKLSIGFGLFAKHLVAGDDVLKQYGITLTHTADGSLNFQDILGQVSDKFNAMGPGVERTAASMNLFGRSGKSLLPLLSSNSDELARLAKSAKDAGLIMSEDDVQASRAFGIAQRQLGEAVKGLEVNIGRELVPTLLQLIESFTKLVEAARPLAEVVFKAVADAATSASQGISEVSLKIKDLLGIIPGLKTQSDDSGFSLATLAGAVIQTGSVMDLVRHPIGHFTNTIQRFKEAFGVGPDSTAAVLDQTTESLDSLATMFANASEKLKGFAGMTRKETRDFRDTVVSSLDDAIGSLTNFDSKFGLTAKHAVENAEGMADKAKTISHDYKALDTEAIPEKFQAWLMQQGPDAVHGYIRATSEGKKEIRAAWSSIQDSIDATTKTINHMLLKEGTQAGIEYANGLAAGMGSRLTWVGAAGARVAHAAVVAAKAEFKIGSPSKVMMEMGQDLITGLIQGLFKDQDKLTAAVDKVMGAIHDRLSNILSKSSSFSQSIRSGFSSLLDISGAIEANAAGISPIDFFQSQLAAAKQFAHVLKALQTQGAGKALLSAIAGQGPEAIPLAQTLLSGGPNDVGQANQAFANIAKIADKTGDSLTNRFFGDKIADLRGVLVDIRNSTQGITVNVNGVIGDKAAVAKEIRDELLKLKARNATTGL